MNKQPAKGAAITLDNVSLDDLYEFMEKGSMDNAPAHISNYVTLLDKVRGMHLRIDKYGNPDSIIRHLMKFDGLTRIRASKLYQEALEYFYCDNIVSNDAWKNIYADKADKMITMAMLLAKDVNDMAKVVNMIKEAWKLREREEREDIPDEFYKPRIKIYTSDAHALGLPKADRNRLKELIEQVPDLTEKEKHRIYQEAEILPFKLFADESEDPRKS